CLRRAAELTGRDSRRLRVVSCHLGAGCSATAFRDGAPRATTMGYTPLDGLMMGTRSGALDPGIGTHLLRAGRLTAEQFADAVEHRSGLLGVSGVSADYRRVEAAARGGHERARLALNLFIDRVRSAVGGLAVTLGGLDALVFTGGIGEHSADLRAAVCEGLGCLGVRLDAATNRAGEPDRDVAAADSPARVLVVRAREEQEIAREARSALRRPAACDG
ncbi:MAG: acetate kinase, partial [Isosphaera sp.]|nr:acetate kinase [Isosphaera sp.]